MSFIWSVRGIKALHAIKLLLNDVFNDAQIGECVETTLKEEFKQLDDILIDLNTHEYRGKVIKSISHKITENKYYQKQWNEYNEIIIYELICKVLKQQFLTQLDSNNCIKQTIYSFHDYTNTSNGSNIERKVLCVTSLFRKSLKCYQWIPQDIVFICCNYIDIFPDFITIITTIIYDQFQFENKCRGMGYQLRDWILSSESVFIPAVDFGFDIPLHLICKTYKSVAANTIINLSTYQIPNERDKINKLVIDTLKHYQNKDRLHFMNSLQNKGINNKVLFNTFCLNKDSIGLNSYLIKNVLPKKMQISDKATYIGYKLLYFMDICNKFSDLNDKNSFIIFQSSIINYVTAIKLINIWRRFIKQSNIDSKYLLAMENDDEIIQYYHALKTVSQQYWRLTEQILEEIKKCINISDNQYLIRGPAATGDMSRVGWIWEDVLRLHMEQCIALCKIKKDLMNMETNICGIHCDTKLKKGETEPFNIVIFD
eukprot:432583_1